MEIKAQGRLLGLVALRNQPSEQMRQEVDGAAVARVLDLAHVFELINDGLDERMRPARGRKARNASLSRQIGMVKAVMVAVTLLTVAIWPRIGACGNVIAL
jgi:hypothetical protein